MPKRTPGPETTKTAKAAASPKAAKAADSAKSAKAAKAADSAKSAKAAKAADSAKTAKAAKAADSAKGAKGAKAPKVAASAKAAKAADSAKAAASPKAADSAKVTKAAAAPRPSTRTVTYGSGTADDPWLLKTPPLSSEYQAWKDERLDPPALVVQVGSTRLSYQLRCIEDLAAMLKKNGDWVLLGNADEGKPTPEGSVEAWARSPKNPVGGYYGLRKGYRGRFANYVPPVLELLGLIELEHGPRNNRARSA